MIWEETMGYRKVLSQLILINIGQFIICYFVMVRIQ